MTKTKYQQSNTPRRKRYNRKARLQNAKKWAEQYKGNNLAKGYSKWFGVDILCAITELEMLGYRIKQSYKDQVKLSVAARQKQKEKRRQLKEQIIDNGDDSFYFIAGYTENGVPFGITWDDMEEYPKSMEDRLIEPACQQKDHDNLPF